MRIGVIPTKSPAHKLTCLTLYRTLLRQSLTLPPHLSKPLLNLIGQRFHLDRRCTSPPTIVSALSTARSALILITSAAKGDGSSIKTLTTLLSKIESRAKQTHTTLLHQHSLRRPTAANKLRKIAHLQQRSTKLWKERIPNSPPILSRPVPKEELPNQEKPRRVPHLTSTQGIPFLRYKSGSQSLALSHVLRSMYGQMIRRWDVYDRLVEDVSHGALEDDWDALVHEFTGVRDEDGPEYRGDSRAPAIQGRGGEAIVEFDILSGNKSWAADAKEALEVMKRDLANVATTRTSLAKRMREIVLGEKALAEKEKAERKEIARAKWVATQVAEGKMEAESVKEESPSARGEMAEFTGYFPLGPSRDDVHDERDNNNKKKKAKRPWELPRKPRR